MLKNTNYGFYALFTNHSARNLRHRDARLLVHGYPFVYRSMENDSLPPQTMERRLLARHYPREDSFVQLEQLHRYQRRGLPQLSAGVGTRTDALPLPTFLRYSVLYHCPCPPLVQSDGLAHTNRTKTTP